MLPNSPKTTFDAVNAHVQAGRTGQAVELLQRIAVSHPREAKAPFMLGVIAYQAGQLEAAVGWLTKSNQLDPQYAEPYFLLGVIHQRQNQLPAAITAYKNFLARKPGDGKALNNLGRAVLDTGDFGQAIAILNQAVNTSPPNPGAFNNLGDALRTSGDSNSAIEQYNKAIAIDPNCAEAHGNLGVMLAQSGQTAQAIASIQRAIEINPQMFNPRFNLAKILRESGRIDEAMEQCQAALQLRPNSAEALNLLGNLFGIAGQIAQCIAAQRRAVELKPDFAAAHSNLLLSLHYLPDIAPEDLFAAHQQWAMQQTRGLTPASRGFPNSRSANRPLRIGYVSPNLNSHSVAYFFESVLATHDRDAVDVFCYWDLQRGDATTDRLRNLADHWREIAGKSDAVVAGMILKDGIDILVDLAGHTAGNRMPLFARRPAPVQITWLGYPDTTGLKTIDYRITDAIADPPGQTERFHTEKLLRVNGGAWAYGATESPDVGPLPALAHGHVTFGSFNNLPKVTIKTLENWSRILLRVPGSRLILKSTGLSSRLAREHVAGILHRNGIAPDRVEFIGWRPTTLSHLELYNRIDIALDTFPYNGTTTTCEALWMGVPVITFPGATHVSRVGTALLTHANCPQWIAADVNGYVDLAVDTASRLPELSTARSSLREILRTSNLCNANRLARELESIYRQCWQSLASR